MRVSIIVFLLLLAIAVMGIWHLPYVCLNAALQAAEQGNAEEAKLWLSYAEIIDLKANTKEAAAEVLEKVQEQEIDRLISEGRFEEALEMLRSQSGSGFEDERIKECLYGIALSFMHNENYAEAEKYLKQILDYKDVNDKYRECEIAIAYAAFESGDIKTAQDYIAKAPSDSSMQALHDLILKTQAEDLLQSETPDEGLKIIMELWLAGKVQDAELIHAEKLCYPFLYEDKSDREILDAALETNAQQAKKRNELIKRRNMLPGQVLAVGNHHTVAVKKDGTMLASGDNTYGQCNVSDWTEIVAVAAGAYHTIALKEDGTVVATGDNRYGQCETTGIQDAVEIDAHGFDTIIRLADGSVKCLGLHDYGPFISSWKNIRALSAAGYALTGITEDGTAMATSPSLLSQDFRNLIDIDAATGYAAGITADGNLVTSSLFSPGWQNVILIDAEANGIMGLIEDGSVCFHLLNDMDVSLLIGRTDIVAIAYSGTHAVVLLTDGTYLACGDNEAGQCDVFEWGR